MSIKQCIAIYIRLSSEDDNIDGRQKMESNSVGSQRKLLHEFVEHQQEFIDVPVIEYVDDGYSGTNFNRPGFKRMMEDAKAGRIQVIVIKDFSRFGRDHLEVGNYLEKVLPLLGVRLISVNDGFDSNNNSGVTGGMSVALKNMLNAMYSRDLSKKVRSAMSTHAANGEYVAAFPKYGYIKDPENRQHLIIDPEAAEIVRLVFTMAAEGKNKGEIVRYLNENHVLTCREYMNKKGIRVHTVAPKEKKLWTLTTISDMLKNEVYLGKTVWNKKRVSQVGSLKLVKNPKDDWIIVEGTHEPIVSEELFAQANARAFTGKKRIDHKKRTKCIVYCPSCGRTLSLTGGKKSYRCSQAAHSGLPECSHSKMDREKLHQVIMDSTKSMVQFISDNLDKKKKAWSETSMQEEKIATLKSERNRLSARKMKLYSDYRSGDLSKEQYLNETENSAKRIEEIDNRIPEIEAEISETRKAITKAAETQTELNDIAALKEYDSEILSKVIDKVFVYGGGKIEIVWKMNDIFFEGIPKTTKQDVSTK